MNTPPTPPPSPTHLVVRDHGSTLEVVARGSKSECFGRMVNRLKNNAIPTRLTVTPDGAAVHREPPDLLLALESHQYPTTHAEIDDAYHNDATFHAFIQLLRSHPWLGANPSVSGL